MNITSISRKSRQVFYRVFLLTSAMLCFEGLPSYAGNWNTTLLNTASRVEYLSGDEKKLILEINKLRSDPAAYAAEYLEPLVNRYRGKMLHIPGETTIRTKEGVNALTDAIRYLKKSKPVPVLIPDFKLSRAARDHLRDQSASGRTGHTGSDGSSAQARIRKYGTISRAVGENIFYGEEDPALIILHLVIDDGIAGRGHRLNLLEKDYRLIGVAIGHHPQWRTMSVFDFADSLK